MKLPFWKQFILFVLIFSIAFNADLYRYVQAADNIDTAGTAQENIDPADPGLTKADAVDPTFDDLEFADAPESEDNAVEPTVVPASVDSLAALNNINKDITNESENIFNLASAFGLNSSATTRITMPASDLEKIKMIYYMSKVLPDYENDYTSLYRDLPTPQRTDVDTAVTNETRMAEPRYSSPQGYFTYLRDGDKDTPASDLPANLILLNKFIGSANDRLDSEKIRSIWAQVASDIAAGNPIKVDSSIIARITGLTVANIETRLQGSADDRSYVSDKITYNLKYSLIDIRVIKTLVYLVTPKSEGGAGHWKIRVSRIFQKSDNSNESQPETASLTTSSTTDTACPEGMSAADCGYARTTRPDAEVEDENGQQYEAYIQDMTSKEDQYFSNTATAAPAKKPTSVHANGQAFDISEIDDIRCTLIQKKRVLADKVTAQPIQPIKLAWQTNEGFSASGGGTGTDVMGVMKSVASDTLKQLLSSFNGDMSTYDGDLSRASFDDLLMILGQSMIGYAVSGNGSINMTGYDTTASLRNLGGMYLADYMGLPRQIFMGQNALDGKNDVEDVKYLIGRTAIEQRLGLPYGSLDNTIVANGKEEHNLDGLLTNLGRRKIESEMNLDQGALKDLGNGQFIDFAVGKSIIEQEFNLKAGTWPTTDMSFSLLKGQMPALRIASMRSDPGSVDKLFHVGFGTTQALIDGAITENGVKRAFNSFEYARMVGNTRMNDTITGLKYFETYDESYQLPQGTWEKAINGKVEGFRTIGIYTLARMFGSDYQDIDMKDKLPEGFSAESITTTEDTIPKTSTSDAAFGRDDFGRLAFRMWLRENLDPTKTKDDACKSKREGVDLNVTLTNNQGRTLQESMDIIRAQICPLEVVVPYTINYNSSKTSLVKAPKSVDASMVVSITEEKAKTVGLDNLDLYKIMGYSGADGRTVFTRIGSKILYYALANKALSKDDRIKIDLKDVNPTLQTDNKDLNFYVDHVFTAIDLASKIKTDWELIKTNDTESKKITDSIDEIISRLGSAFSDKNDDVSNFQKMMQVAKDCTSLIADLAPKIQQLKEYYQTAKGTTAPQKVAQINGMIIHINSFAHTMAEMIAGKEIKQVDDMVLNQIQLNTPTQNSGNDNGSDRRTSNQISSWKMASLIFSFLAGDISATELFVSIGSGVAEANLGLPTNSLYYLVQNYEKRGLKNIDAFYEAIGQARIEEQFNMPVFYFQGFSLDSKMPVFSSNNSLLKKWLPDVDAQTNVNYTALKKLTDDDFDKFLAKLLFPELELNSYGTFSPKRDTNSPMPSANYSSMIWAAERNWQTTRTAELAKNGRSVVGEKTIADVVRNVEERGYGDGIRTGQEDLLLKMGLPSGAYADITSASSSKWSQYSATTSEIDNTFGLKNGSTKSLFTGEDNLSTTSITNKEKKQIEASSLNIGTGFLEKYIQLVNGEILPSEMDLYRYGQVPDYIENNPYAQGSAIESLDGVKVCGIVYSDEGGFSVNNSNSVLDNGSFCYYDQKGRHCFRSSEEAQRYANAHDADSIKHMRAEDTNHDGVVDDKDAEIGNDILGYMAMQLTTAYNYALLAPGAGLDAFGRAATDDAGNNIGASLRVSFVDIYSGLVDYVSDKNMVSIFDKIKVGTTQMSSATAFALIADQSKVSTEVLTRLFSRTTISSPVANYKKMVGQEEAKKILTAKLFNIVSSRNLSIGPFDANMFDAGDFYDILNGDFSSISRIGARIIDEQMGMKPGTTALIWEASSPGAIGCALEQAGSQYFGQLFGLTSIPLKSNIRDLYGSIGQTKIEETLGLPAGSFRGETIEDVATNVGPINFAVAFKIPQNIKISDADLTDVLGANRAEQLANAGDMDKISAIQRYLTSVPVLSNVQYAGMKRLEGKVMDNISYITNKLSSANAADLQNTITKDSSKEEVVWHNEVAAFVYLLTSLDNQFSIASYSTYNLFAKGFSFITNGQAESGHARVTPTEYVKRVSKAAIIRAGAIGLGNALGFTSAQSGAALDLLTNLQVIFFCSSPSDDSSKDSHSYNSTTDKCQKRHQEENIAWTDVSHSDEPQYHNWNYIYTRLQMIFNMNLDKWANVPDGTMGRILTEPQNTLKILMEIGAGKIDQRYGMDSSSIGSATGLFKYLYPTTRTETMGTATPDDSSKDMILAADLSGLQKAIAAKRSELAGYQSTYDPKFGELVPFAEKLLVGRDDENNSKLDQLLMSIETILKSGEDDATRTAKFQDAIVTTVPSFNSDQQAIKNIANMGDIFQTLLPMGANVGRCQAELDALEANYKAKVDEINANNEKENRDRINAKAAAAAAEDANNPGLKEAKKNPFWEKTWGKVWNWARDAAAEQIVKTVGKVEVNGENVGFALPFDHARAIFSDIRYMGLIAMTISANYVMIQIDRLGNAKCQLGSESDGKCGVAVPKEFRFTYQDFYNAVFGLPGIDADRIAAYIVVTGNTSDPTNQPFNAADPNSPRTNGDDFGAGYEVIGNVDNTINSADTMIKNIELEYDMTDVKYANEIAEIQAQMQQIERDAEGTCLQPNGSGPNGQGKADPNYKGCYDLYVADTDYFTLQKNLDLLQHPSAHPAELKQTKDAVLSKAKLTGWKKLQYKLMDIGLWKLDDNIYAGFSSDMITGNAATRLAGLAKYIENGLRHGHLFGIRFDAMGENGIAITMFMVNYSKIRWLDNNPEGAKAYFIQTAANGGLDWFANWASKQSYQLFDVTFKLPPDVIKGIIVGAFTGNWGFSKFDFNDITGSDTSNTTDVGGGVKLPTLSQALAAWLTNALFSMADRTFHWKTGTAFLVFQKSYELYKLVRTTFLLNKVKSVADYNKASPEIKKLINEGGYDPAKTYKNAKEADKAAKDAANASKAASIAAIFKIVTYFTTPAIHRTINKYYADDFREFEDNNGLVPGSLDILIDPIIDIVSAVVVCLVIAIFNPALGLAVFTLLLPYLLLALLIAAVIFIIINLFGVYQIDYYCTADGYQPMMEGGVNETRNNPTFMGGIFYVEKYHQVSAPAYAVKDNDISGLGVWGGQINGKGNQERIQKQMQEMAIESAQYKAKRLLEDLLSMQKNPKYNDSSGEPTVPIQIMTGRQVDVDALEGMVTENMCQAKLGDEYIAKNGICVKVNNAAKSLDVTRMGLWFNPQNVAFTHVGF
ncbi:MAG: hypothetical protein WCI57_03025 [Candidatus Berkelbacteria bacterium]